MAFFNGRSYRSFQLLICYCLSITSWVCCCWHQSCIRDTFKIFLFWKKYFLWLQNLPRIYAVSSSGIDITGKKDKELVHSGVHNWNHVWTEYFKKPCLQRSANDHGAFQQQSPQQAIRWYIQANEWLKWPEADLVEIDSRGILFYWKSKKLE